MSHFSTDSAHAPITDLPAPQDVSAAKFLIVLNASNVEALVCSRLLPAKLTPKIKAEDYEPFKAEYGGKAYFAALRAIYTPHGLSTFPESHTATVRDWQPGGAAYEAAMAANRGDGRGVYFSPLGAHTNGEAAIVTAYFAEIDGVPLEEQFARVMALPIQPHIIIATRNSLHCYWLALPGVNITDWQRVQRTLIRALNSDYSIAKPAQLMRLPGFDHVTLNRAPEAVERVLVTVRRWEVDAPRLTAVQMLAMLAEAGAQPFADERAWREYVSARNGKATKPPKGRAKKGARPTQSAHGPLPDTALAETFNALLARLDITGPGARENEVRATCPACADGSPSLMAGLDGERILFHCYAGCQVEEICAALGLRVGQLFSAPVLEPIDPREGKGVRTEGKAARDGAAGNGEVARQVDEAETPNEKADLVALVKASAEIFHDAAGEAYAAVMIDGRRETYRLKSRQFKTWLRYLYHSKTNRGLSAEKFSEAVLTLEAVARYEGVEREVHLRVAEHDGAIYVDLCDAEWRQVKITASGWTLIGSAASPVYFRREEGMLALPVPESGGSLETLRKLLNLAPTAGEDLIDDEAVAAAQQQAKDNWTLLLIWLVVGLKPSNVTPISYPLLAVAGEQGSGKSTLSRIARTVIDPHRADLRAAPKDTHDLAIAANRTRVLAYDNLAKISAELSNALCRTATGGAYATRTLYSDDGETIFEARRLVLINGINKVIIAPDLQERTLSLSLARVYTRKKEAEILAEFQAAHPKILGALFDAVAHGLGAQDTLALDDLPRMADACVWAAACAPKLGLTAEIVRDTMVRNQQTENLELIQATPLAAALLKFLAACPHGTWGGTVGCLLSDLNTARNKANEWANLGPDWPQRAESLARRLTALAPVLRRAGVTIKRGARSNEGRLIELTLTAAKSHGEEPALPSLPSYSNGINDLQGDGSVTVGDGSPDQPSQVMAPATNRHQPSSQLSPPNPLSQLEYDGSDGSAGSFRPVGAGDGNRENLAAAPEPGKHPLPPLPPTTTMPTPDAGYQPDRPLIVPTMPPGWGSAA